MVALVLVKTSVSPRFDTFWISTELFVGVLVLNWSCVLCQIKTEVVSRVLLVFNC
jgi:hypothetical protein